jgi:ATP-dependent RNA helicase DDX10/DBP4
MLFTEFGLSAETQKGLDEAKFIETTTIQQETLPFTLAKKDVLAQARTGSGKTLAFLIPVLEKLYHLDWNVEDGLGALVISPTRELALQIFQVLRKVGKHHSFSAGLLIGGKDLKQEQGRVNRMNILITTPGRLLQHMDQTPEFDCNNLQILVLDEADRILDSGFEKTVNAIIENLPKQRQTLLFSATQTKAVKDLARLSIKDAEYIAVDKNSKTKTPKKLTQKYVVTPLPQKLDVLFSFIRSHLKQKTLVFLSSCKQVRFVYETFRQMRPGIPLLHLHGKQNQQKRIAIFEQFSRRPDGCLFATDVAARGLDIPEVDWVVQVDCPEDVDTYIHRVGRTARYNKSGSALLLLLPSEVKFVEKLEERKVPIEAIKINPAKTQSIQPMMASLCSQSPDIKYLGQKAFICYMRSIFLQKDKDIFDVHQLPSDEFAESLGLPGTPNIKFVKSESKNRNRQMDRLDNSEIRPKSKKSIQLASKEISSDEDSSPEPDEAPKKPKTRVDKMFNQRNTTVLSEHYKKLKDQEDDDDGDDILQLARANHDLASDNDEIDTAVRNPNKKLTRTQRAKQKLGLGSKFIFEEDGTSVPAFAMQSLSEYADGLDEKEKEFISKGKAVMSAVDITDKQKEKERRKELKRLRKEKEKKSRKVRFFNFRVAAHLLLSRLVMEMKILNQKTVMMITMLQSNNLMNSPTIIRVGAAKARPIQSEREKTRILCENGPN